MEGKLKILVTNQKADDITRFYPIISAFGNFKCNFVDRKCPSLIGVYFRNGFSLVYTFSIQTHPYYQHAHEVKYLDTTMFILAKMLKLTNNSLCGYNNKG